MWIQVKYLILTEVKKSEPRYPFGFTYAYDEWLPYDYQCVELDDVKDVIRTYSGAFKYEMEPKDWLRIEYSADESLPMSDGSQKVTGIKANVNNIYMAEGEIYQLAATISPGHALNKDVIYKSSNDSVVSVTDAGIMTCNSLGEAVITITSADSGVSTEVKVTGRIPVKRVTVKPRKATLDIGETLELEASASPDEATFKGLIFKSLDDSIATVDEKGVVTAVGAGTVSVKVESEDDSTIVAYCSVTVSGEVVKPTDEVVKPTETLAPEYTLGDVNQDGNIDARDALLVLKHAAKIEVIEEYKSYMAADTNEDNNIDAKDALIILKIAAKINI